MSSPRTEVTNVPVVVKVFTEVGQKRSATDDNGATEAKRVCVPTTEVKKDKQTRGYKPKKRTHYNPANKSSRFNGVTWNKTRKKWLARITYKGKRTTIGSFDDEVEAAKKYDEEAIKLLKENAKVNFKDGKETPSKKKVDPNHIQSKFRGVVWRPDKKRWIARFRTKGVRHYCGMYSDEEDAARSYDRKAYNMIGTKAVLNFDAATAQIPSPERPKTTKTKKNATKTAKVVATVTEHSSEAVVAVVVAAAK